ncbi:hypothetical protein GME_14063 [Halomonas sp. TD01]|nr:hypothetical protein GME_14063 [Halomonas sp. TD01]
MHINGAGLYSAYGSVMHSDEGWSGRGDNDN